MSRKFILLFALFLPCVAHAGILVKHGASKAATMDAKVTRSFDTGWQVWDVGKRDRLSLVEVLRRDGYQVEMDDEIKLDAVPNDPQFGLQWGLHNTGTNGGLTVPNGVPGADVDAVAAWDIFSGDSTFRIGVVDSGLEYANWDIRNNVWTNPGETAGDGIDNDGNGFIDDIHGWDFGSDDSDPLDVHGHGTHVSGIIAARGDNARYVTGVCWKADLVIVKFTFGTGGSGYTSDAIAGLQYLRNMGVKVVNCSWGSNTFNQALADEHELCRQAGMLFAQSAGNGGYNLECTCSGGPGTCTHWPARSTNPALIVTGATDANDEPTSFSNFGTESVDLFAPGRDIYSLYPVIDYWPQSGTSMAAPHVAGAAALIWGLYPSMTAEQVKARIMESVDPLPSLSGKCVSGGRLNLYRMLTGAGGVASGGGGGTDPIENFRARESRPWRDYDVQGRRVEGKRSGVVFSDSAGTVRKRAVVR